MKWSGDMLFRKLLFQLIEICANLITQSYIGLIYVASENGAGNAVLSLVLRIWTEYRPSKECGLSESAIANIFRRNILPSISTFEAICAGFGITVSQFFC